MKRETTFAYVDGNGYVELEIPNDMVNTCYHGGECAYDVENALTDDFIREQFDNISDEQLIRSLSEVWDNTEDIVNADRHVNEMRALWIACGNVIIEILW